MKNSAIVQRITDGKLVEVTLDTEFNVRGTIWLPVLMLPESITLRVEGEEMICVVPWSELGFSYCQSIQTH